MSESALADVNSPSARFHLTISAFATTITRYSVVCCLFHRTVYTSLTFFLCLRSIQVLFKSERRRLHIPLLLYSDKEIQFSIRPKQNASNSYSHLVRSLSIFADLSVTPLGLLCTSGICVCVCVRLNA